DWWTSVVPAADSGLDLTPLLAQALVRYRHLRAQLLGEQRHAVFLQHPAIQRELRIALAFLGMLGCARLVLFPVTCQFARPHAVTLYLSAQIGRASCRERV